MNSTNKNKKLILVGSRRNLTDITYTAKDLGYEIIGILDKHYFGNTDVIDGVPVIGSEDELLNLDSHWRDYSFFPANWWDGSQDLTGQGQDGGQLRQQRISLLEKSGVGVVNLIHPTATFFHRFDTVTIGRGNLILGDAKFGSHISIGDYNVIDWLSGIGIGTTIGNNVIVGASVRTAHVNILDNSRIGAGCILIPRKKDVMTVGPNSVVYIGSTCTVDVPPNSVYTMHNRVKKRIKSTV